MEACSVTTLPLRQQAYLVKLIDELYPFVVTLQLNDENPRKVIYSCDCSSDFLAPFACAHVRAVARLHCVPPRPIDLTATRICVHIPKQPAAHADKPKQFQQFRVHLNRSICGRLQEVKFELYHINGDDTPVKIVTGKRIGNTGEFDYTCDCVAGKQYGSCQHIDAARRKLQHDEAEASKLMPIY